MRLIKIVRFEGKIICKTPLHIGGINNQIKIGGVDSEVIKDPITQYPYIPGSSLKGKMRSQLEKVKGKVNIRVIKEIEKGEPCGCGEKNCVVCTLFGAHKNSKSQAAPTRLIIRDSYLTKETIQKYNDLLMNENVSYLEQKAENIIDRKLGTADSPRFIERVPAGSEFELNMLLQIFEGDDEKKLINTVEECLTYVEDSYLGSSGSRGYGQVVFEYKIRVVIL